MTDRDAHVLCGELTYQRWREQPSERMEWRNRRVPDTSTFVSPTPSSDMHGDIGPFDRFAPVYDLVMPRARTSKLRAGLAVADREISRALDVGGGPGRAIRRLDIPDPIVVDAAWGMLEQARSHGLGTVAGDATRLPVKSESVDAVLIVDALHHMSPAESVVSEAARVLRPGGVLVIREFDPSTVLGRGLVTGEHIIGFESQFYTPDELAGKVETAGLESAVVERGFGYTVTGVRKAREQSEGSSNEPI